MDTLDDMALLREYAGHNSEAAFTELVSRRLNFVYSAALRQARDPRLAEEITQTVFVILAQRAGRLSEKTVMAGWLFKTTHYAVLAHRRDAARRREREQEIQMQSQMHEPALDPFWDEISPLLDDALAQLGEKDRQAVLLRFFENKSLAEVGTNLGTNEDTARKRVGRAVEKLRRHFMKRGVACSTAVIGTALAANSVQAAPAGLQLTIAATAVKGSAVAASTTILAQGTMKLMSWVKYKFAFGAGVALLVAGGAATLALSQPSDGDKAGAQEIAKKSQAAYAALTSYSDSGTVVTTGGGNVSTTTFNLRLQRPNLYRIDWTHSMGDKESKGSVWNAGDGNYLVLSATEPNAKPQKERDMQQALSSASGVSSSAASIIPAAFFKQKWGDVLGLAANGSPKIKGPQREADATVVGVDCFTLSYSIGPISLPNNQGNSGTSTTRLWIGKEDYLIHRTETTSENASIPKLKFSDAEIQGMLASQNRPATPENIATTRAALELTMKNAQKAMKNGKIVFTQTHENITLNETFSKSDFTQ